MSRNTSRSIASAGSESVGSSRQRSTSARGERSASNPASFSLDTSYDTALPPINFNHTTIAHRRTGSTLKTVMRKIFNRKRQSQADGVEESPNEAYYSSSPARSPGPDMPGKSFLAIPTPSESKRSSPLSEQNLQLQLAETHLSPTSAAGGSLPSPGLRQPRRRATLPSVIFSDDESRYAVASALSDPQEDRGYVSDQEKERSIIQSRRRSRSIGALQDLVSEHQISPSQTPWPPRTASIPTSAPDSKSPPLEGSSASGHSARPSTGTTVTSVTRASAAPSLLDSDPHADQVSLPPNVGNLVHTMQQDDGLTLEQRLNTLEVKMIDLEFAIARMQSNSVNENPINDRSRRKEDSSPYVRNKPSFLGGSIDRDESPSPFPNLPAGRPTSTSTIRADTMNSRTIRPAPSASSLSDFNGISIEQYSALVTLLRREQTARRTLESQVSSLQDDIRHIQRAALHSMEMGTMYPIHTVDSQEFLRFRRALDGSDSSPPIRGGDEKPIGGSDSDWDRPDYHGRDDPFGPSRWDSEHGRRVVTVPMI
ncbi:hypothetical protein N7462_006675 [Penicillium macrosclerotiorum]|uniref:uncharacterized protein n=1 Tax=Penicillium macrosclerotiorum TaxID=303699 RepID=UPI00254831F8|nr:uncharacterized protein N7462_006675 [Penicillium macrosclerotiorum]KAJ5683510.1 hypothetical protein N7462_006675 [Penicillium macrosclerotiorum]